MPRPRGRATWPSSHRKTKYTCPACALNAWAKPQAALICGDCREPMEAEEAS